jgi:dUTP pyrophosphatase
MITVRITKRDPRALIPEYKTDGAAAFDLATIEDAVIPPGEAVRLRTGLVFGVPEDHVFLVFSRSSLFSKHHLMLSNNVGVLDSDYCGPEDELLLSMWNPGPEPISVAAGTRVAQGIILPRPTVQFEEGEPIGKTRGGFGSTGN